MDNEFVPPMMGVYASHVLGTTTAMVVDVYRRLKVMYALWRAGPMRAVLRIVPVEQNRKTESSSRCPQCIPDLTRCTCGSKEAGQTRACVRIDEESVVVVLEKKFAIPKAGGHGVMPHLSTRDVRRDR